MFSSETQLEKKASKSGMAWVPGGTFMMGSNDHYPEEAPVHPVEVDGFWMDDAPVTNRQFLEFVNATGYVTFAEKRLIAKDYPGAPPGNLRAGSLVFTPPTKPIVGVDITQWWVFTYGANWRRPLGRKSSIGNILDHPVVHVAFCDAEAYAAWAGKELPSEAEWELAARGGLDQAEFAWGDELVPGGRHMANIWQGSFPVVNLLEDGYERTSPIRSFPPNGFGLYDMIGNTWEWTTDFWTTQHPQAAAKACCIPLNPRNTDIEASIDPAQADLAIPRRVLKGGSHLCALNYCRRYRPAARHAQEIDTTTNHVGFRCVVRTRA
ncbi:formylglycine-generating enzyme family protein [Phyllobacterium pellucidum]|nr:formylglycine-generating enzyme family protein [Phyllobacterium pellucidum]